MNADRMQCNTFFIHIVKSSSSQGMLSGMLAVEITIFLYTVLFAGKTKSSVFELPLCIQIFYIHAEGLGHHPCRWHS